MFGTQTPARKVTAVVLITLAICATVSWAAFASMRHMLDAPLELTGKRRFEVPVGASAASVAQELGSRGLIQHPRILLWYARWTHKADRLKAGFYELSPGESARVLLDEIVAGRVMLEQITIIEGWTYRDLRRKLAAAAGVRQTLAGKSDAEVMSAVGSDGVHPEGQFFPDTYRFAYGTPDLEILKIAHDRLRAELADAWAKRTPVAVITTPYAALTLASLIEKESARAEERRKISGVYVHRLVLGMRLQADPTIIYGLGERYDGDLRTRDLRSDGPYNTYTRGGLPPTPIALPGREALIAAAQPLDTGAIFFVATGTPDGSHYFSSTLAEHNAAVRRLLARQRNGTGSR